jgi:Domain of unknown function (DUF1707)
MNVRQDMRASDHDRQQVVDVLRAGLEDGRLTMEEYTERMGRAYEAVTCADLAPLSADLPAAGPPAPEPRAVPRPAVTGLRGALAGLPTALRVLWAIWLSVVGVNVVVWALVCVTTASLIYLWPLWVAGPYGAVLLAVSAVSRGSGGSFPRDSTVMCSGARAGVRSARSR